jgi:hypothetical protein
MIAKLKVRVLITRQNVQAPASGILEAFFLSTRKELKDIETRCFSSDHDIHKHILYKIKIEKLKFW